MPAFHFHSFLLIFVNLWPISTLCVADMVHAVADVVCGRYRRLPGVVHYRASCDIAVGRPTNGADYMLTQVIHSLTHFQRLCYGRVTEFALFID